MDGYEPTWDDLCDVDLYPELRHHSRPFCRRCDHPIQRGRYSDIRDDGYCDACGSDEHTQVVCAGCNAVCAAVDGSWTKHWRQHSQHEQRWECNGCQEKETSKCCTSI